MKERIIALLAGDSGTGKSFFCANLKKALIFDTDIGGGLSYAQARIEKNGSVRIEVSSYADVRDALVKYRKSDFTSVAIDHLSTLHEEACIRHNPSFAADYGRGNEKAAKDWRLLREEIRKGDYNLFCTSHLKARWENEKAAGMQPDAAKKIEADFHVVLYIKNPGTPLYPLKAQVAKWRRDPDDPRGKAPASLPFTVEDFLKAHGADIYDKRHGVEEASKEQVAELERLIKLVNLPEGTVDKWLSKAKVEALSDMPKETIDKCIAHVNDLIKKKE